MRLYKPRPPGAYWRRGKGTPFPGGQQKGEAMSKLTPAQTEQIRRLAQKAARDLNDKILGRESVRPEEPIRADMPTTRPQ